MFVDILDIRICTMYIKLKVSFWKIINLLYSLLPIHNIKKGIPQIQTQIIDC